MTLIVGQDRGDTLYVGSRKSDVMGRLYDKGRESGDEFYKGCWRWEVQHRAGAAMSAMRSLVGAVEPSRTIEATVGSWFRARGVTALFGASGDALDCRPPRAVPDDARFLEWARKSIQPRARQLVKRYGWRFVAEALVGPIATYEDWETMIRGIEFELEEDNLRQRGA